MKGTAAAPDGNHLLNVNETNAEELIGEKKYTFTHIVMQLLYHLRQREQPDICTAVVCLADEGRHG